MQSTTGMPGMQNDLRIGAARGLVAVLTALALALTIAPAVAGAAPSSYFTGAGIGNLGSARYAAAAAPLPDGRILIAGGYSGSSTLNSAEVFDPATNAFTSVGIGNLSTGRFGAVAAPLPDGRILIAGGYNGGFLNTAEVFESAPVPSSSGVDFGTQTVAQPSSVQPLRVTNLGVQALRPTGATLSGPGSADFTIVEDRCAGERLQFRQTCEVDVRFTPGAAEARNATVQFASNATDAPRAFPLAGTGVAANSGPGGPPGPGGPAGPPGADGKDAKVTCKVKKARSAKKVKVTCKVQVVASSSSKRLPYLLTRGGRTYAWGSVRIWEGGHGTLRLRDLAGLPSGRYMLRVGGENGTQTTIRVD